MIKLFIKSDCLGSKKAEDFFKKNDIKYDRVNLSFTPMKEEFLFLMQEVAPNLSDLINFNSEFFVSYPHLKEHLFKISAIDRNKEILDFILEYPEVLSYPIAFDVHDNKKPGNLLVGFNDSEWKVFLEENNEFLEPIYSNINKSFVFESCCFYDEVKKDDTDILVKLGN
ncbi:MAG: hypothetical protein K2I76_01970 [Malacoplasma sp.]|nr:hypothetical protein [Malacoplasma sp.]MDE5841372.1 hypothetical protein [Malacoplasma sp.]MDE6082328.1 hypothetical protein [Malacoplasma sp.]MDE6429240.1 hypothetical protein [Malacoplasma sp.]MDE6563140.1 hypothetical protein [Malacoplasma sp.]